MKKNYKKQSGFTLIELLVVSTIIVVLSAIGLVSYSNAGKGARNAKRKSDIETVRQALVLFKSDTGAYPAQTTFDTMMGELIAPPGGYISEPTPEDPKDGDSGCGTGGATVCGYLYTGSDQEFTLSAPLEGTSLPNPYVVTNP